MTTSWIIFACECSILAAFILFVAGFVMLKWKRRVLNYNTGSNEFGSENKFIILPKTGAKCIQLESHIGQFQITDSDLENNLTADECSMIDETINTAGVGRLYFSLKYDAKRCLLTIKLIKGENLPTLSAETSKAYVNVQIITDKTNQKAETVFKRPSNTVYQRTYTFVLQPNEFVLHNIQFEISRFDRFSRKYDIGCIHIALSELRAQGLDLKRESFFTKDITCTNNNKAESRKRRHSSNTDQSVDESQTLNRAKKDAPKVQQRNPQVLWDKLSHAVRAGLFQELRSTCRHESLQWDPFLIVQRYEYSDSDTIQLNKEDDTFPTCSSDSHEQSGANQEESEEGMPEWIANVFNTSTAESHVSTCSPQEESESQCTSPLMEKAMSLNQDFYHLVHSPSISCVRRESLTSWSIPETFQFPPSPIRIQTHTVMFQSASATKRLRQDRLHKLTSLSANYREKILRKSRKRGTTGRGRLAGRISFHESLYLDKDTRHSEPSANKPTCKRLRREIKNNQ